MPIDSLVSWGPWNKESKMKKVLLAAAAIVALPLSMAIAIGSGVSPDRGLYTAIVGGFLISLLGGSRFQIGGPAGAFIVNAGANRAAIDASLKRLGMDYVDLYQTHIWDPTTNLEEMMQAFDDLVRVGCGRLHDDRQLVQLRIGFDLTQHCHAIHLRHLHIGHQQLVGLGAVLGVLGVNQRLHVADGGQAVHMPFAKQIAAQLRNAGFIVLTRTEDSDTVEAGLVVRTSFGMIHARRTTTGGRRYGHD